MTSKTLDWTHKNITIKDIRKLYKLYIIKISDPISSEIESPLFVKDTIFEDRLRSYFLKDVYKITREEILSVKWNMYITKSFYIKANEQNEIEKFYHDPEKWYISYLEIDGPLGSFFSVYRDKEIYKDKELNK